MRSRRWLSSCATAAATTRPPSSTSAARLFLDDARQRRSDRLIRLLVRRLGDHRRRTLEALQRLAQRIRAQRALAVGQVLRLVAVRVGDVGEVDVERRAALEDRVGGLEHVGERLDVGERAVARRVHVREVDHRPHPAGARARSRGRRRGCRSRGRGPSPRRRTARRGPCPRAARAARRAARTTAEIASLRVRPSRKPGWKTTSSAPAATATPAEWSSIPIAMRCFLSRSTWPMNPAIGAWTESTIPASRASFAEPLGPRVVHPEPALEVDLAGVVAALAQQLDGLLRALPGRNPRRAEAKRCHAATLTVRARLCRDAGSRMMRA